MPCPWLLPKVVYELIEDRGVNTEADSCEYRDNVLLEDEIVANDMRLSLSDILSVAVDIVYLDW